MHIIKWWSPLKRIKLKKNTKLKRIKIFIIIIISAIIFALVQLEYVAKKVEKKLFTFAEIEVNKLSKAIVNQAVNDVIANKFADEDLFEIGKNSNDDIQIVDFNPQKVNLILNAINENINSYFERLENGERAILDIKRNTITNTLINTNKKGVVFELPIGMVSNNAFLSNLGPKIPVRVSLNGELESCIKTRVENYGINNAVITVYVYIEVSEQILLPITSKKITIKNEIPISIKMMQGNVPNYYFNGLNTTSDIKTFSTK